MLLILLYSYTQLAIISPYKVSILCVLAIAKGGGYLIVRKDSSKSGIKVKETFIDKLIEAN